MTARRPSPASGWRRELKTRCRTRGVIRAGDPALCPRTPGKEHPESGHNNTVDLGDGFRLLIHGVFSATVSIASSVPARQQRMLKIMARENMSEWGSSVTVEHETIRAVVEAYGAGLAPHRSHGAISVAQPAAAAIMI
jgi:hypothetical protein